MFSIRTIPYNPASVRQVFKGASIDKAFGIFPSSMSHTICKSNCKYYIVITIITCHLKFVA